MTNWKIAKFLFGLRSERELIPNVAGLQQEIKIDFMIYACADAG